MLIPDFRGFPEPQYTRMPNLIYDSLAGQLSLSQLRVLLFFVRATMGWRKDHEFVPAPISQIEKVMGLSKPSVIEAIQFLEENHFITRRKTRGESGRQGVTEYRLCFVGDTSEAVQPESKTCTLEIPESKTLTLDSVSRVKVGNVNLYPGGDPSFSVFKENIKKENTPLPPSSENSANELPTETLTDPDADPELEATIAEEIAGDTRARQQKRAARDRVKEARRATRLADKRADALACREQMRDLEDRGRAREEAGRPATISPPEDATQHPAAAQASTGSVARSVSLPEEAEIWNELVTNGTPVLAFDWERQEGRDLRRCRDQARFSLDTWRRVCEKAQKALENECGWVTFRWLLKSDESWWKVLQGEYDTYKPREKSKAQKREDFITRKLKELHDDREAANRA